jgi:hypothetical protein
LFNNADEIVEESIRWADDATNYMAISITKNESI